MEACMQGLHTRHWRGLSEDGRWELNWETNSTVMPTQVHDTDIQSV